jgi:molecular chaperone DnaJ
VQRASVEVDVPAGIADGNRIRVSGRGHAGERGGPAGDLYVHVRVKEDPRFVRDGNDLVTVVDVAAPLAALGTTVEAPTLDGPVEIDISAGTQPGEIVNLRGQGMPSLRRGRPGDLRVVVNVVVPRRLSHRQRELLEELSETITEENLHSEEGIFSKLKRALGG